MSSTGRGAERRRGDAYYTPDALADAIVRALPTRAGPGFGAVLEPHVGGGAFARACSRRWPDSPVFGMDIDQHAEGAADCVGFAPADFLAERWPPTRPALIIGNPPFSNAEAHIRRALDIVDPLGSVVFLLRLAMLEGQGRAAFWAEHPPTEVLVLHRRPSFTGQGTDSCAYAAFRWTGGAERLPVGWLTW